MNERYEDKYGRIWERMGKYHVWNSVTGTGLWDSGKGLVKVRSQSEEESRNE